MELINRKNFLKMNLPVAISFLLSPYFSIKPPKAKTYLINCYIPKRIFQGKNKPADLLLKEVAVNYTEKNVQFSLSNDLKLSYKYSDTVSKIAKGSLREAMKLKILLSYSLFKLCQDDKKNSGRNQKCNADTLQTQEFLDTLEIDNYAAILNSFRTVNG
jgi:hypothetical protein